ncbi:MAG TPA: methyltransferase domain-containing protein, partial [Candidatus Limnocylindrales bacterium]
RADAGSVLGIDLSRPMLARARRRAKAAGLGNVQFVAGDAQIHPFDPGSYDVVISRMAMMFMADPSAAFANLARALRSGGRLAVMVWQAPAANEWTQAIVGAVTAELPAGQPPAPGAPGPFALADPVRAGALLEAAGFTDLATTPVAGPLWFGSDVDDALEFLTGFGAPKYALDQLDPSAADRLRDRLRAVLGDHVTASGVSLEAAAWIYSAQR